MNYYLKQKGWSNLAIAEAVGCHRDTVRRMLCELVEYQGESRHCVSQIAVYDTAIEGWLKENMSVRRMLELVRNGPPAKNADAISVLAIPRSSTEHSLTPPYNATNTTAASAATAPTVCSRFSRSCRISRASSTVVPG